MVGRRCFRLSLAPSWAHAPTSLSVLPPRSRSCPSAGPAETAVDAAAEGDGAQVDCPVDCRAVAVVGSEECQRGVVEGLDEITAGHEEGHDDVVGSDLVGVVVVILDGEIVVRGRVEEGHDGVVVDGPGDIQLEDHVVDDGDAEVGGWSPLGLGVVVVTDLFKIQIEPSAPN